MPRRQRMAFRVVFFLYVAAVLFLCFARFDNAPSVDLGLLGIPTDKLVHFAMFCPFPVLAYLSFNQFAGSTKATFWLMAVSLAAGLLLALGTEWGQAHLTSYRMGDSMDFAADTLGLLTASVLVLFWNVSQQKKQQK